MGKLITALKRLPKRTSALVAIAAAAVIVPATLFAWGPDRPTYTIEHPADHVTFNSITNNPAHGDERNFVQVKPSDAPNSAYAESVNLEAGKEYTVYIYYHNNAASNLNASGKGIAQNAYVRAALPAVVNGSANVVGHVGASNAKPQTDFWDEATFKSSSFMALRYVDGSATIHNFGQTNGKQLPDSIINSGTPLGFNALDGKLPGCNEYAGYVTLKVKADQPNFTVNKTVRLSGTKEWKESVQAQPGASVDYQIEYKNTGTTKQNDVVIRDVLPAGMTYVNGSTMYANATHPSGTPASDNVTKNGINIGNYLPGANAFVKFTAKVPAKEQLPKCGDNLFHNVARAETNNGSKEDSADVTVPKECQPEVSYKCEGLTVDKIERTKFKFTTATSEQNATFKKVTYVIRNEQGTEVERKESTAKTLEYTRTQVGKYTVEALVTFTVNGTEKTVTDAKCKKPFEVTEEPVTPVYRCDSLTVSKIERTKFKFDTKYTAQNATLKSIVYVIRDGNGTEIARQTSPDYTQTTPGNYSVEAIVTVTVDGQDKVAPGNCKAQFEVVKEKTPKVDVDKKVDGVEHKQVGVDQQFTYQIRVTNTGDVDLKDTVVTDAAPQGVTFLAASAGSIKDNAWTYTIAELKVGKSADFTITAKVPAYLAGKIVNTVCVESPQVPGNPDDCDDATVEVPPTPCVPGEDKECTPEVPETPETPKELPKTGASEGIIALIGAGSLIASLGYYIASRRSLIG
jgi:uncharacterized repeat protein (TIGR01451 family)/LPXTG-motif cell wall-anchored protein